MKATKETIYVISALFLLDGILTLFFHTNHAFALSLPLETQPWTVLTSVYAHAGFGHLIGNAITLAIAGILVESQTTRWRFHGFFITVGVLSGITQVVAGSFLGTATAVLGASGAIFGLMGYAAVNNPVMSSVLDSIDIGSKGTITLFAALGAVLTFLTAAPQVALIAHFTGFFIGAVSGWKNLL